MTKHSLFPVPKVLLPAIVAVIAIIVKAIATGEIDRGEVAAAAGLALTGWLVPPTYDQVQAQAAKVVPGVKPPRKRRKR